MKCDSNTSAGFLNVFKKTSISAVVLSVLLPVAGNAQNLLLNGSFETLSAGIAGTTAGSYTVNFGGLPINIATGWTLGISGNNSGYDGIANANGVPVSNFNLMAIANGTNSIFLQGAGTVSQTVNLGPGSYLLSYSLMGRAGSGGGGINGVDISLSGDLVSVTQTPANTDITSLSDWTTYTETFSVTSAGDYTLQFTGHTPFSSGDNTSYLDDVSITSVPEPSSFVLGGFGVLGLILTRRFLLPGAKPRS